MYDVYLLLVPWLSRLMLKAFGGTYMSKFIYINHSESEILVDLVGCLVVMGLTAL